MGSPAQSSEPSSVGSSAEEPTMNFYQRQWSKKFEELKKFQRENKTLVVRQGENNKLYQWVRRQKQFLQRDDSSMNKDELQRVKLLLKIGFERK